VVGGRAEPGVADRAPSAGPRLGNAMPWRPRLSSTGLRSTPHPPTRPRPVPPPNSNADHQCARIAALSNTQSESGRGGAKASRGRSNGAPARPRRPECAGSRFTSSQARPVSGGRLQACWPR
jgi:hypothetical protein